MEDIQEARERFSVSRMKELGDEYQENYPWIQVVLNRFFGLGNAYLLSGMEAMIKILLVDDEVKTLCAKWIYNYTMPERFIHLLYSIGFVGVGDLHKPQYRPLGASSTSPPPITPTTHIVIHPSYAHALNLHTAVIGDIPADATLSRTGVTYETPGDGSIEEYIAQLNTLEEDLKTLPRGKDDASRFEMIVGDIIKLCFFRSLTNVEARVREVAGCSIRDWIASNTATSGFWEVMRNRYHATQIIWECKNYDNISSGDFYQVANYMTQEIGRFAIIAFRGEITKHYYDHIKRISADKNGIVLLLTEADLKVFIRQAKNGKVRENHIQEKYDRTVREIS